MANIQALTIREQAAVKLYVHGIETSPQRLYQIAHPGRLEDALGLVDLPATASRWIRSRKVVEYIEAEQISFRAKVEKERLKIESETIARLQTKEGKAALDSKFIDYSTTEAQLSKLNEIVNSAKDPSEALDALKILIARKAELQTEDRPGSKSVMRFYVPINCKICPLKAKAQRNTNP